MTFELLKLATELDKHQASLNALAITDQYLFTGDVTGKLHRWRLSDLGWDRQFPNLTFGVNTLHTSPDHKLLLTGGSDATLRVLSTHDGRQLHSFKARSSYLTCLAYHPLGYVFAGFKDDVIHSYNIRLQKRLSTAPGYPSETFSLLMVGDELWCGLGDGRIEGWPLTGFRCRSTQAHDQQVFSLATCNGFLLTAGADRELKIWDLSVPEPELVQVLTGHQGGVNAVVAGENYLYSADTEGQVMIWSVPKEFPAKPIQIVGATQAHSDAINDLALGPSHLFTAGGEGVVKAWELGLLGRH